jgi:hypothetical protein
MRTSLFLKKDFFWAVPVSLLLGALLASVQEGAWWIGWLGFSAMLFAGSCALIAAARWANPVNKFTLIVALAFMLRFAGGVATYLSLPVIGYNDVDDKAGHVYTDANRRDAQAWELAGSDRPVVDAFQSNYAYDQYGGLLAFSALIYRVFSPDAHRSLMLVLVTALIAALGVPFLWKAAAKNFGEKVAWAVAWIFALYPESILLGGSAMRESYIMTFSAIAFWGFLSWLDASGFDMPREKRVGLPNLQNSAWVWLGVGLLGMILVSPSVALFTLVLFAGWIFFSRGGKKISWQPALIFAVVFVAGLFFLSASLNRSGDFNAASPLSVVNDWLRLAVKWNVYGIERDSGWVQKLFDEMPAWMRLPFVTFYGILRPVLPATLVDPIIPVWKVIYNLRALGWYALLPMLALSFMVEPVSGMEVKRPLWMWVTLLVWTWILLSSLRGGGDDWDNSRYRALLFMWQALMGGVVWVWWRESHNAWVRRVLACEIVFLLVFTYWYASRYFWGGAKLPFAWMVAMILGAWAVIVAAGLWLDRRRA